MEMKRILLHVAFWTIYTLQDTFFGMAWFGSSLGPVSNTELFWRAGLDALLCLVAKFIFTYFLLEVSIPRIVSGKYPLSRIVGEIVVVLIISLFIYRLIAFYLIFPLAYKEPSPTGLLSIRGVLGAVMDIGFVSGVATAIKLVEVQLRVRENEKLLIREKLESELKFL